MINVTYFPPFVECTLRSIRHVRVLLSTPLMADILIRHIHPNSLGFAGVATTVATVPSFISMERLGHWFLVSGDAGLRVKEALGSG